MSTPEVPPEIVVGALRNEIARLNDERLTLAISLQHAYSVIETLQELKVDPVPDDIVAESS